MIELLTGYPLQEFIFVAQDGLLDDWMVYRAQELGAQWAMLTVFILEGVRR